MGFATKKNWKKIIAVTAIVLSLLFLFFLLFNWLFPFRVELNFSQVVKADNGKILHAYLSKDDKWRMKVEPSELTPELKRAFLYKEDQYFYYHPGVNPFAICRALANNIFFARRTSGASTITMQLARLLEPRPRTYASKIVEAIHALQLEWNYSKDDILLFYLSLVPYGGNIEGIKSASVLFLEKSPKLLSTAEIAALTVIPNRPGSLALGKQNDKIMLARNKWLERYASAGLFSSEQIEDALLEPLTAKRHNAPNYAPHFSRRVRRVQKNESNIYTNLNVNIQTQLESLVRQYVESVQRKKISNAAVLVIDNEDSKVVAYAGSADFSNVEDAGQVDGVTAVRSPGSTLKPFLYAMALDEGLITPKLRLLDVETDFGSYSPQNFDRNYSGAITAEKALATSLNVPAVRLLSQVGVKKFVQSLIMADFKTIDKQKGGLGLSLVLGGCGSSLEELCGLYAAFANRGLHKDFSWFPKDSIKKEVQLISPSAAYFLSEVLADVGRPDLPANFESSKHLPRISWKTGTSYGRKDAWSIGFNERYTIGVWLGNFSAKGVRELTGADIATPLLFKIFNVIDYDSEADWFLPSEEMRYRSVCSETGLPLGQYCEDHTMDYYIPLVSPNKKCKHIREVFVSVDERYSYCRSCLPSSGYKELLIPQYPPALITYFQRNLLQYRTVPQHNPDCERIFSGQGPRITSPTEAGKYLIDRADNMELMLYCDVPNDVETIYWYINQRFYRAVAPGERVFFEPRAGKNRVSCVDDKGRKSLVRFDVEFL